MRRKSKIVLSLFALLFVLFITVNLPVIAYGYDTCSGQTEYESYMDYQYPCFFGCSFYSNPPLTVTLSSVSLYSGITATSSLATTSSLVISLKNPCAVTTYV